MSTDNLSYLHSKIRTFPDFPQKGVMFRDIMPLLADARARKLATEALVAALEDSVGSIDAIAAVESRGFFFGIPLADRLGLPLIPLRRPGKLPGASYSESYGLEYGSATLHVQCDAIQAGDRILIVDDVLATGGTAKAAINLIERAGGVVDTCAFLIELPALSGRDALGAVRVASVMRF